MFEVLDELPFEKVVTAVCFALRVLQKRHLYPTLESAIANRALAGFEMEPTLEERLIAVGLIEEVIKKEKGIDALSDADVNGPFPLSEERANYYRDELSKIPIERLEARTDLDLELGERILNEMRREYAVIPQWKKSAPVSRRRARP